MIDKVKIAIHRLKSLKGFVMPEDLTKLSPLAYKDHLDRRRVQAMADTTLSEKELSLRLVSIFFAQRFVEKQINVIQESLKA